MAGSRAAKVMLVLLALVLAVGIVSWRGLRSPPSVAHSPAASRLSSATSRATRAEPLASSISSTEPSRTSQPAQSSRPSYLTYGDTGPGVAALQERLVALHYWVGTTDGVFGDSTLQAVYALQKAAGISRDGVVGPATERALRRGVEPVPRASSGYLVEINLGPDLLMVVRNDRLLYTFNTSTGGGYVYYEDGVPAVADTPVGLFQIYAAIDGMVVDPLGELWRPRYFYDGFAIHGDSYVPPEPVSHGCVRVSNEAIDWIWARNIMPIGTRVWVY